MEPNHFLHSAGIRNELELVTGDAVENLIQKTHGPLQGCGTMKRRKAAREQFAHRAGTGERSDFVLPTMLYDAGVLNNKDALNSRLSGRCKRRLAVPRRAVHPQAVIVQSQDDAIVAENLRIAQRFPKQSGRALAGSRVSKEKMPPGFGVHQAGPVDLNSQAVCQIVCDQKFVGGILERKYRVIISHRLAIENQLRVAKACVSTQALIRIRTKRWAGEIEDEFGAITKESPKRTRVENRFASPRLQPLSPLNIDFDIRNFIVGAKHLQFAADPNIV